MTLLVGFPAVRAADRPAAEAGPAKSRTFLFTYRATVTGLPADKTAHIWLPVPSSNEYQDVRVESERLPAGATTNRDPKFGNQILYVEARPDADGKIHLSRTYRITRREARTDLNEKGDPDETATEFLRPDRTVPIDGPPLELIKGKKLPSDQLDMARVLYDVVNEHMRYSKEGTGWGRGDSVWACRSGYGNCTDFHSLFMSLARSQKIPCKFIIGFPLPDKLGEGEIPGYHCWAYFRPAGHAWIPVDISEANKNPKLRDFYFGNLTSNRVSFSRGRDLNLVPRQAGEPLNFFIYPYVEVDDKPYGKVEKKFTYKDLAADGR
jgi:transglutaminase-like putative cysteine protease